MEKEAQKEDKTYTIELANKSHVDVLTQFQLNLASETQNLKLDQSVVNQAITFFFHDITTKPKNQLGMYLIKLHEQKVLGTLLLTFQSQNYWWILSVYIIAQARRKGHFSSLFNEAVRLGKEKKVKRISLYVETENERAQNTYKKLGMHITQEKMYSYDFVIGNQEFNVEKQLSDYQVERVDNAKDLFGKWVEGKVNVFTGLKYQDSDWDNVFVVKKGDKVCGVTKIFSEFSDWRNGLMWYFRELYIEEDHKDYYQSMLFEVMKILMKSNYLKVVVVRVLYRESQQLQFKGGHLEHYHIMSIDL